MKTVVKEHNSRTVEAWLKDDESGEPVNPTTLEWRIRCETTGQTLQDYTATTVQAIVNEFGQVIQYKAVIPIPAALNAIQDRCNRQEVKVVKICADRGLDSEWSTEVEYYVVRDKGRN